MSILSADIYSLDLCIILLRTMSLYFCLSIVYLGHKALIGVLMNWTEQVDD